MPDRTRGRLVGAALSVDTVLIVPGAQTCVVAGAVVGTSATGGTTRWFCSDTVTPLRRRRKPVTRPMTPTATAPRPTGPASAPSKALSTTVPSAAEATPGN